MASHIGSAWGANDASGTALAASTTIAVNAGDLLLVFCKHEGAVTTIVASDNAGGGSNAYTGLTIESHTNGDLHARWCWAIAKASETLTFTVTLGAARAYRKTAVLVGRPTASFTFDLDNQATAESIGGTVNHTTSSYATAGGAGYACAGFGEYTVATWTPGTGWTEAIDQVFYVEYRLLTNESSILGAATSTASMECAIVSAAFKEVASASGPPQNNPTAARGMTGAVSRASHY